ncbi:MAG: hypothetical protein LBM93_11200 [Oscillospiraceae bacterium]|jgi:hypothetical protein|nr:hypothetical protein [Oscillospiraceae bacterium]
MQSYSIFPFGSVPKDSKILIYGAGGAGSNYFNQVRLQNYCEVLFFIDKNAEKNNFPFGKIRKPSYLKEFTDFDYIVIANLNIKIGEIIFNELKNIGVPECKIILPKDNTHYWSSYGFTTTYEQTDFTKLYEEVIKISPNKLVSSKRVDVIFRYLLMKDIFNNIENTHHQSLYSRYLLAHNNAEEPINFFSDNPKAGLTNYLKTCREIINSIISEDFKQEKYISVDKDNGLLNGFHRLAGCLACGKDVYVKQEPEGQSYKFTFKNIIDYGFNVQDKISILRGFSDVYAGNLGICILFSPIEESWEYIHKQLLKHFTVVGDVTLDFTNNYFGFDNIIYELYDNAFRESEFIERKIEALKFSPLYFKVILVSDEDFEYTNEEFYEKLTKFKLQIRDSLYPDILETPIVMHASDSKSEFIKMKHILFSNNNIDCACKIFHNNFSSEFINNLQQLRYWCDVNNVPTEDVVIVGSSAMEIFGIKKTNDIDIVISAPMRKKLLMDEKGKRISNKLEIRWENFSIDNNLGFKDDVLLYDDNYYFFFNGFKFTNLNIIKKIKIFKNRDKDIYDLRRIQIFEDFVMAYDNKERLLQQIEIEMARRLK